MHSTEHGLTGTKLFDISRDGVYGRIGRIGGADGDYMRESMNVQGGLHNCEHTNNSLKRKREGGRASDTECDLGIW